MNKLGVKCEYFLSDPYLIHLLRNYSTCFFYMVVITVLTKNFLDSSYSNLKVTIVAMPGYLLKGALGF